MDLHLGSGKSRRKPLSDRRAINGLQLFELCCQKIYILDEQQRSQDQNHSNRIDQMRNMEIAEPFTLTTARRINELMVSDVENDIKWAFDSVFMSPTNASVNAHNYIQMHKLTIA